MTDREKVIRGLECCNAPNRHEDCPYDGAAHYNICTHHLLTDAIALLREKEPLTIHDPGAICPNCKWPLYPEDHPNYCGNCGNAVSWE